MADVPAAPAPDVEPSGAPVAPAAEPPPAAMRPAKRGRAGKAGKAGKAGPRGKGGPAGPVRTIRERLPGKAPSPARAQRIVVIAGGLVLVASWAQDIARGQPPAARPLVGAAFLVITLSIGAEFAPSVAEALALLVLVAVIVSLDRKVWDGLIKVLGEGVPKRPGKPVDDGNPNTTSTLPATPTTRQLTATVPSTAPVVQ